MSVSGTPTSGVEARPRDPLSAVDAPAPAPTEQAPDKDTSETGTWNVRWLSVWQAKALTILGFAIPAVGYLVFLRHYQVNAVWQDQWDDIPVIRQSFLHFPDWSSLWAQHADNRLLFPNLIVVALAHTVNYNIDVEEFLSALMLFGATALLIASHKRRSPNTPLLYYCPIAFLTLSIAQYQNTLWGFQMAWYLVLLTLALTIFVLDRPSLGWPTFLVALLVAVVGSYSSVQGLLIWPVGLILLYHRRRPLWTFIGWIAAAGGTAVLYFHGLTNTDKVNPFDPHYFIQLPGLFIRLFIFALGDIVGLPVTDLHAPPNAAVMTFGIVIFALAVFVVLRWGIRRDREGPAPIGIVLIVFGFLFDAMVVQGRFWFGYSAMSASRYTTNDLLVLVGIYMTVLGGTPSLARAEGEVGQRVQRWQSHQAIAWMTKQTGRINRGLILRIAFVAIVIQVVFGLHYGVTGARQFHQAYVNTEYVTRNIGRETDTAVFKTLYFASKPAWTRVQAQFLQQHHLSQFG